MIQPDYFVITSSADGVTVEQMSHGVLAHRLMEGYYGQVEEGSGPWSSAVPSVSLLTSTPVRTWDPVERAASIIIKGEVVTPEVVKVVKEIRLP